MGKNYERKHKKHLARDSPIDEKTLAKVEVIKAKREKTVAEVELRLEEKFNERSAITRANMFKEDLDLQKKLRDESKPSNEKKMIEIREEMKEVILDGVRGTHADQILKDKVKFDVKSSTMTICGKKFKIKNNVHMVGWGLDALMLGSTFERIIGEHLKKGWLVVPQRTLARMSIYTEWFPQLDTRIVYSEARNNEMPDEVCVRATRSIFEYCKKLRKKDILVVVLSTSADELLCLPKGMIGLREKIRLLNKLREAGASTREVDLVRRSLSAVRGGGLARVAYPAKVISLVMSDAGSHDLHLERIAGGPTVNQDLSATRSEAKKILEKYGCDYRSNSIIEVLNDEQESARSNAELAKIVDDSGNFKFVSNFIVASAQDAVEAMSIAALRHGYFPIQLMTSSSVGTITDAPDARIVGKEYTKIVSLMILAAENKITPIEVYECLRESKIFDMTQNNFSEILPSKDKWCRGLYVLIAGLPPTSADSCKAPETKYGYNQELALYFSLFWYLRTEQYPVLKKYVVWFLGCASSGRDRSTDCAGAYAYGSLGVNVYRQYIDAYGVPSKRKFDVDASLDKEEITSNGGKGPIELSEGKRRTLHETILPDRVLANGNTNLLFLNINDEEELLRIGDTTGYTFTNVGDLHAIRIVRYQCDCDGLYHQ